MRPPEFTGGNARESGAPSHGRYRFNEAAGIHRRKRVLWVVIDDDEADASMRPPEFTGGNAHRLPW